jgi:hypothetical protein
MPLRRARPQVGPPCCCGAFFVAFSSREPRASCGRADAARVRPQAAASGSGSAGGARWLACMFTRRAVPPCVGGLFVAQCVLLSACLLELEYVVRPSSPWCHPGRKGAASGGDWARIMLHTYKTTERGPPVAASRLHPRRGARCGNRPLKSRSCFPCLLTGRPSPARRGEGCCSRFADCDSLQTHWQHA